MIERSETRDLLHLLIAGLLCFIGGPSLVDGKMRHAFSLEYMASRAEDIGIYRVSEVSVEKTEPKAWDRAKVGTILESSLKGSPEREYGLAFDILDASPESLPTPENGRIIVFFDVPYDWWSFTGDWRRRGTYNWVIGLDTNIQYAGTVAVTSDFRVLASADSILQIVTEYAGDAPRPVANQDCGDISVEESAPGTSEAYQALWSGSAVYVTTMLNQRHSEKFLSPYYRGESRAWAATMLSECFEYEGIESLLYEMLSDPEASEWWTGDSVFVARQYAYDKLISLGRTLPVPDGYRDDVSVRFSLEDVFEIENKGRRIRVKRGNTCEAGAPVYRNEIPYPDSMLTRGAEGKVDLEILVGESGEVLEVEVASVKVSRPPSQLTEPLLSAARDWTFEPITVNGKPRNATIAVPITSSLPPPILAIRGDRPLHYSDSAKIFDEPPDTVETHYPSGWTVRPEEILDMEVRIDASGNVIEASLPYRDPLERITAWEGGNFERAFLDAVKTWKFKAPTVQGVPTEATVIVPVGPPRAKMTVGRGRRVFLGTSERPDKVPRMINDVTPLWDFDTSRTPWNFAVVVQVDTLGNVIDAKVPSRALVKPLVDSAIQAVRNWKYPPHAGGKCRVRQTLEFRLPDYAFGEFEIVQEAR